MKARTAVSLAKGGRLGVALRFQPMLRPFYRACFLAGALRHGVLDKLAKGALPFDELAADLAPDAAGRDALTAWLRIGCLLGELEENGGTYGIRGYLARKLVEDVHDPIAAVLQEIVLLHSKLLVEGPGRFKEGRPFTLADQEGEMIARSSRILEPLVVEALEGFVPAEGKLRLLEIGCGSGVYVRHAADRNPQLTALGLELQPEVAELARGNVERWGLGARVEIDDGDVREQKPDEESLFDLATLHNNIYYFPVDERVALLRHLRKFLKPGGKLLLTTATAGGGLGAEVLSLWAASTAGCGRLPSPEELFNQLREAGFEPDPPQSLLPGEAFYSFVGVVPR